jgi:lysophospholipase L1-like esterase
LKRHHQRRRRNRWWLCWWWLVWSSTVLFVFLATEVQEVGPQQHRRLSSRNNTVYSSNDSYNTIEMKSGEMIHHGGRLLKEEEPWKQKQKACGGDKKNKCDCTSLDILNAMSEEEKEWQRKQTEAMVRAARNENNAGDNDLDIVMLGDSITRGWNGKTAFQRYFNKTANYNNNQSSSSSSSSSSLQGLALGVGGDTSIDLLRHLQHGLLDESTGPLQPKVWLLLIGTNDLSVRGTACTKRSTLANILNVATYLRDRRPGIPIVLHGILPRGHRKQNHTLHDKYSDAIEWINQELKDYCNSHPDNNFHYLDASDIFLKRATASSMTTTSSSSWIINEKLMKDALHPTANGYMKWAPRIVKKVQILILTAGGGGG